jgi:hypothetical protein
VIRDLSLPQNVQTVSGAYPASYTRGSTGFFPRVKNGWGIKLTIHLCLGTRLRMSGTALHLYSPYMPSQHGQGKLYLLLLPPYTIHQKKDQMHYLKII